MNPSGPSAPPMSQSPRQYPANLPQSTPYQMQPLPPPGPPYPNGPYAMPPMPQFYPYPPNYPMAGPSNQMMSYPPMPPPYYAPPPHQYMYPIPPLPPQQMSPYSPVSPRPFDPPPRQSDFVRHNGGSPHRGQRNFPRNHHNHNQSQHFSPPSSQYRPPRPAKLTSPVAPGPSSPFPLQTATQAPPGASPVITHLGVDTASPGVPNALPNLDTLFIHPPASNGVPDQGVSDYPQDQAEELSATTPPPIDDAELATSSSPILAPLRTLTPTPSEGPVGLSDASTATPSTRPESRIAILNSRPDDPSKAYSLMFSHRSKPPQSVLESAEFIEEFDPKSRERSSGLGPRRAKHTGTLIPAPEYGASSTTGSDDEPVESNPTELLPEPAAPASSEEIVSLANAAQVGDSLAEPTLSTEKSIAAPLTPTLSSSVQSSTAVTPTSHTPSPSSPISTATSISAQPSPSAAKDVASAPGAPTATAAAASSPILTNVATSSKPAPPKTWAALFVKKPTTAAPTKPATQLPLNDPNSVPSEPSSSTPGAAAAETSSSSTANGSSSHKPADPSSATSYTTSNGSGSLPPLHELLSMAPPLTPPAPLTHPRGLVNTGNMCFANVIMQALLHTPPFYKLFEMMGRAVPAELGRRALIDATVDFLREFPLESTMSQPKRPPSSGKSTPLTAEQIRQMSWQDSFIPQSLYDAMSENKRFDSMRGGRQEDAEEFLGFVLDTLHEELLAVLTRLQANPPPSSVAWAATTGSSGSDQQDGTDAREVERPLSPGDDNNGDGWLEVGKKNKVSQTRVTKARDSAITRIFGGKIRNVIHTPGSGKDSVVLEPYQHLQLDIQPDDIKSVEDALRHLTQPETLHGITTPRGIVDGKKQTFLETLPPILILHLKRFIFDGHGVQKSTKPLLYKATLEVPKDVLSPTQQSGPTPRYRLYGVVYHHGKSTAGGHYTIDLLRQNQSEWLRIDDTDIKPISESDVALLSPEKALDADRTAYLLFYQRIPDTPAAPAPTSKPQAWRGTPASTNTQKGKSGKA